MFTFTLLAVNKCYTLEKDESEDDDDDDDNDGGGGGGHDDDDDGDDDHGNGGADDDGCTFYDFSGGQKGRVWRRKMAVVNVKIILIDE